jgi:hypothetical protein
MKNKLLYLTLTFMYLLVNAVFVLKYSIRIVTHGSLLVVLYLFAVPVVFWLLTRLPSRIFTNRTYIAIVIAFSVFMGIVFFIIPQESLRVDRYEMIKLFWDNTFSGINPYTPREHTNIPGPFPCYFILALPFYLSLIYYMLSARTSWTEICVMTSWTKFFDNRIAITQFHEHQKQYGGVHERRQHTATDFCC